MKARCFNSKLPLLSLTFVIAAAAGVACNSDPVDFPDSNKPSSLGAPNGNENGGSANGNGTPSTNNGSNSNTPANKPPSLAAQKPVMAAQKPANARQVINAGPFTGQQPTVRANEFHTFDVTGKDCMTCHGAGGSAPHFAVGGTIALGKKWTTGIPTWSSPTAAPSGNGYDSYDGYGSYDSDGDNGGGYGSYSDDGYGDGAYSGSCGGGYGSDGGGYGDDDDDGAYGGGGGGGGYGTGGGGSGYGDDEDDGDYGYGGGGTCGGGTKGWPADRTSPSPYTGVRLVGADGYMFDTVTDTDGNFWFKAQEDIKVPAYTGIRYGTFTVTGDTNGVACASCHESGKPDSPGRLWTWDGPTPKN